MTWYFRKILCILFVYILFLQSVFSAASKVPNIECWGLPCPGKVKVYAVIGKLIGTGIKYVAVIAVLAVMYGGIMYLLSGWEEEKTKKAKTIIIWALAWVFISVLAWSAINVINNFLIFGNVPTS